MRPRMLFWSAAWGVGMTTLAAAALAYLTIVERGPQWLRTFCVAAGVAGTPFWLAAGVLGARAGGPRIWTTVVALAFNILVWAIAFFAVTGLFRSIRRRPLREEQ